jgi:4-oxalomesaconate hydratase
MRPIRLLCVGGHPADAFDSAGGTLAHHVERGDHVSVMALTQGTRIHDVVISDTLRFRETMPDADELGALMAERARVKEDEVRRACGFLGITDVHFFRYDDSAVTVTAELIDRMARFIRENRPDVVITHHPHELGAFGIHHAATSRLVLEGIAAAGGVGAGDPNPPHHVAQVYFTVFALQFPVVKLANLVGWAPDVVVDITDVVERKVRALDALRSQQYGGNYARKTIEQADGSMGRNVGIAYGEGFIAYRPVAASHLPIDEATLERAAESEAALHARMDRFIAPYVDLPE